jgi:heme A synthase
MHRRFSFREASDLHDESQRPCPRADRIRAMRGSSRRDSIPRIIVKGIILAKVPSPVAVLRRFALPSAAFAFALVAWGAIVRINGAGMTCPDWPRCRGVWLPALDDPVVYEWTHRLAAALLTFAILATWAAAYAARAQAPSAFMASWFSVSCIVAQIIAGWLTIKYANDPPSVAVHLVVGFATFASLAAVVLFAYLPSRSIPTSAPSPSRLRMSSGGFARLALASTILAVMAVFAAGYMSAANDGLACTGFPLCNGLSGALTSDQQIHMGHRYAAYATIVAVFATWLAAVLTRNGDRAVIAAAWTAFALAILQGTLGVLAVMTRLQPVLRSWHEANGALLVGSLVILTILAFRAAGAGAEA